MSNIKINTGLIKKIISFFEKTNSLKYLDPNIFDNIDEHKEVQNIEFDDYFLEHIQSLPKLDFESAVKIAREVYQLFGKEKEFDMILSGLVNNHSIEVGSLNKNDDNCITKASESRILLTGTYYDVVLLCHEIGHKLRFDKSMNSFEIMDSFLFETPSIILELAANNYLRDNYGIDIETTKLRKMHVLSSHRDNNIENKVFLIVIKLLKAKKLDIVNLYIELAKDDSIVEYLNRPNYSIEDLFAEGMSAYSYDVGYILGNYVNNSGNEIELLNLLLKYKDKGINMPYTIEEEIIESALEGEKYTK